MRLTLASLGQDLTWLLRDAGPTVPLEATRRAVLAAAGAVVTAARCEAYDPVEMAHRNMVSIRADPGDQGRMEGLAAQWDAEDWGARLPDNTLHVPPSPGGGPPQHHFPHGRASRRACRHSPGG